MHRNSAEQEDLLRSKLHQCLRKSETPNAVAL